MCNCGFGYACAELEGCQEDKDYQNSCLKVIIENLYLKPLVLNNKLITVYFVKVFLIFVYDNVIEYFVLIFFMTPKNILHSCCKRSGHFDQGTKALKFKCLKTNFLNFIRIVYVNRLQSDFLCCIMSCNVH